MNEKEAKVPENLNEWEEIDIYLFTNGQQFSPPRKYHLKSQELASWGPLLNYLARAQYGYLYSTIDLYTIEGEQISGPLELSHGLSYVAVEPNGTFIEAGYDQYLMKASRSWLKRYRLGDNIKSDDMSEIKRLSWISTNIENLNEQNSTATTKAKADQPNYETSYKEQENAKINLKTASKANGKITNNVTATKSVEKQSVFHRNSVSKRSVLNTVPSPKNEYLRKHSPLKDNLKVVPTLNRKASIKPVKFNKLQVNKMNTTSKTLIRAEKLPPEFVVPLKHGNFIKQKDLPKISETSYKEIIDNDSETKVNKNKKDINSTTHSETVSKIHGSGVNTNIHALPSIHETVLKVQDGGSMTPIYLSNDDTYTIDTLNIKILNSEVQLPIINTEDNTWSPSNLPLKNKDTSHSNNKIWIDSNITSKTGENVCDRPILNSSFALIDPKNTVNLKISIEVKNNPDNGDNRYIGKSKLYNDNAINTLHEKESEVNFDEIPVQNVPLHKLINELHKTDQKIVLINYNPCNIDDYLVNVRKLHAVPINANNGDKESEVVVKLSRLQQEMNLNRCSCEESTLKVDKQVQTSNTIVETDQENRRDNVPEKLLPKVTSRHIENSITKHKSPYQDVRAHATDVEEAILKNDTGNIQFLMIEKDYIKSPSKVLLKKYTQTDISNLLLEARQHEDSHYSFHLPPLYVLKHYNLQ